MYHPMPVTEQISAYWRLTKPRIWGLLVFTGIVAMLVAYRESNVAVSGMQLLVGFVALTLGSAAANTLTNYHDRDIDGVMHRTRSRPLPAGTIDPPWKALVFGLVMAVLSVAIPLWYFNPLSAVFMTIGLLDNVVVYSLLLKRRSWLNIILGGISGGMPVLVGYAAVANTVTTLALYMAALVIVWIPTHIWSLAIVSKEDYTAAKVPMVPVVFGDAVGTVCIAAASALLAVFSIAIYIFTTVSVYYAATATVLGAVVLVYSAKLAIDRSKSTAWVLFKITSPYLAMIFTVLGATLWL